jgi:2-iminobutanoate/2-iminopropanoate deaminase
MLPGILWPGSRKSWGLNECHCEERRDEAISLAMTDEIASPPDSRRKGGSSGWSRNDNYYVGKKDIAGRRGLQPPWDIKMSEIKRIPTAWSYSAAVAAGDFVFLGLHRGYGDDFATQFDNTFKYLKRTLAEFDLTLAHLVKVNVWLKHIKDLREMEKRFNNYFEKDHFPARMTCTTEFIDDDILLMIDGVAYRKAL